MTIAEKQQKQVDPEKIRQKVEKLIRNFESELQKEVLRPKVLALIPVFKNLRNLGKALIPSRYQSAARDRILYYLLKHPLIVVAGNELMVISGIQDYPRRLRELRVQFGWSIASGYTIRDMKEDQEEDVPVELQGMKPSDYILLNEAQDRDAAYRWNLANTIRKEKGSIRDKILKFLRANVGTPVTNEELRYVANNKTEWARRVRELRTEFGWPVTSRSTGRPELGVGVYVLQADRQSYEHDRQIPDGVRREVLRRDGYKCRECNWSHDEWNPDDPRHLEIHHIQHHADGGENTEENLKTLCTICHDKIHKN